MRKKIIFTLRRLRTRWSAFQRRVSDGLAPVSYGVVDDQGHHFFVPAHGFRVDREGRLIFWARRWLLGRRPVSVVEAGKWRRILRGVSLEDF